jgi:hypothetical protein
MMPTLGVDSVTRFGYRSGKAETDYQTALHKYKAKDWARVKAACEQALQQNPWHLDAQWLLAGALAQTGDLGGAVEHLVVVLGADDLRWGDQLNTPDLTPLMTSAYGRLVADLHTRIAAEDARIASSGLWVVARDEVFHVPVGESSVTPHGEVYAYDVPTRRYIRISHTDNAVAGFVRGPGGETALLLFDKVVRPHEDTLAPTIGRGWLNVIGSDGKQIGKSVQLGSPVRQLAIGYTGDQLVLATAQAAGRWGVTEPTLFAVDSKNGKLTPITGDPPPTRIAVTVEDGQVFRPHDPAVKAEWNGDKTAAFEVGGFSVGVPESATTTATGIAVSRDQSHVAFATSVDVCARSQVPSVYVADTKTKTLHHLLTAASRFDLRWYDDATLAYEDGLAVIHLWGPATAHEVGRLEDKLGIALDVLSPARSPLCTVDGAAIELGDGSGSAGSGLVIDQMPPDETANPPNPPPNP